MAGRLGSPAVGEGWCTSLLHSSLLARFSYCLGPCRMVIIDVGQVDDERGLHALLKAELGFPAFYGMNWDAITGLVKIPDHLRFTGSDRLIARVPCGATRLRQALDRYRQQYRPQFLAEYV